MKLEFLNKPTKDSLVIFPIFKNVRPQNAALNFLVSRLQKDTEFSAKNGQTFFLFEKVKSMPKRVLLLGLGNSKKLDCAEILNSFGSATKTAMVHGSKKFSIIFNDDLIPFAQEIAEGIVLGSYHAAPQYKTGEDQKKLKDQMIAEMEAIGLGKDENAQKLFKKGADIAIVENEIRDTVNAPPNFVNTEFMECSARAIAKQIGAKFTALNKKEIEKQGMGGILAVNRGSGKEPRLLIVDYTPKGADPKEPPLVFVGKGILFDSGGYNLKPSGHIEDMQSDKAGAATVLGLAKLLPKLNIKKRVICVAPLTENLIGKDAIKPSEIIKMYSGKTVEVTNTDAEGRLILADAIAYAIKEYNPKFLIDLATLTGACVIALGFRHAGLFGNDKDLMDGLQKAGDEVDELLWPLPIHKDNIEKIKGHYADLKNADSSDRYAGASKGAAFLREFVGKTKWAHLDIAGPAFTTDPKKYEFKGATGFGLRLLARFLEKL